MKEIYSLEVRLSRQEDGLWRAEVPALRGCWVDAPTLRQALHDIQEVAAMLIDILLERGEPLPDGLSTYGEALVAKLPLVFGEYSFKRPPFRQQRHASRKPA